MEVGEKGKENRKKGKDKTKEKEGGFPLSGQISKEL